MMSHFRPEAFFELAEERVVDFFREVAYVWEAVATLPAYIEKIIRPEIFGRG